MAFNKVNFPYDQVVTAGDESWWIELSVTSKNQEVPVANISCSGSKFSNISVPLTLFSRLKEEGKTWSSYSCPELNESVAVARSGSKWIITQIHEDVSATTIITHKDMYQLIDYCHRKMKIRENYSKNKSNKKVYKGFQYLYNLPRKLINW